MPKLIRPAWAAIVASFILVFGSHRASADVKVASIFGDHMVLQRDMPVPVWGTADADEEVSVRIGGQSKSAKADEKGKWKVTLDPIHAGDPIVVEVSGRNSIKFEDVLIGDVWICSGQSNMSFALRQADRAQEEIAAANYPKIRLFSVERKTSATPLESVTGKWQACTPGSATTFTAVGYFFGRQLHQKTNVPIGLIHTSWGGTPAEAWTDEATLAADPDFAPILERGKLYASVYPKLLENYQKALLKEKTAPPKARKAAPRKPAAPDANPKQPSVLYNAMIAPLEPYAIKGAIWYQGEANAGRAEQYRKLLPAMITDWRKKWGQGDFPFLIVQLANHGKNSKDGSSTWAELREAQALTARNLPNCGMSVTIEIGNPDNIHPTNKQDVGKRLALVAEKLVYHQNVEDSGPSFQSMNVEGSKVRIRFDHLADGLDARGGKVEGFTLAGNDKTFVPADAVIDGDSVVLFAATVSHPVAVRYGWANSPTCTLYNKAGLPAPPFRTDDYPMVTAKSR